MEQDNGECCKIPENLELDSASEVSTAFIRVKRCKVCGRRHFGMTIKPIVLDLSAANK